MQVASPTFALAVGRKCTSRELTSLGTYEYREALSVPPALGKVKGTPTAHPCANIKDSRFFRLTTARPGGARLPSEH